MLYRFAVNFGTLSNTKRSGFPKGLRTVNLRSDPQPLVICTTAVRCFMTRSNNSKVDRYIYGTKGAGRNRKGTQTRQLSP